MKQNILHNISDEELIDMMRCGNDLASHILFKRYHRYSRSLAFNYAREIGCSKSFIEDMITIAEDTVYDTLSFYFGDKISNFYPYWSISARRNMLKFVIKAINQSGSALSYDDRLLPNVNRSSSLKHCSWVTEGRVFQEEILIFIEELKKNPKTTLDSEILQYTIDGYKHKEIATLLKVSLSTVKYHYGKIVTVLKRRLKDK